MLRCCICGKERSCRSDNLKCKCRSCAAKQRVDNQNTSITDDVIGFLSNDNVLEYLEKIKGLDEHGR